MTKLNIDFAELDREVEDDKAAFLNATERAFVDALRYAIQQGDFSLSPMNFKGWGELCDCKSCLSQKAIWEFTQSCKGAT